MRPIIKLGGVLWLQSTRQRKCLHSKFSLSDASFNHPATTYPPSHLLNLASRRSGPTLVAMPTTRRQRVPRPPLVLAFAISPTIPSPPASANAFAPCCPLGARVRVLTTTAAPTTTQMVAAPPPPAPSYTRYTRPVPAAKPHEILPTRRGRNSRRRVKEAEHFRKYMFLRRQLKPWSDDFRAKHGRTPNLVDVHKSEIPGLLDRFVEYLEVLEGLRIDA